MKKNFLKQLTGLTHVEFITLEHHISIARMVRDAMTKNGLTNEFMAEVLQVKPEDMPAVLNGGYEFDIRFLANLQAYNCEVAIENAKIKVEAQSIGFNAFRDSAPAILNRLEDLLNVLEKQKL